jgi:hypothetical protein
MGPSVETPLPGDPGPFPCQSLDGLRTYRCSHCGRHDFKSAASQERQVNIHHDGVKYPPEMHERPMDWLRAWFRGTFPRS